MIDYIIQNNEFRLSLGITRGEVSQICFIVQALQKML